MCAICESELEEYEETCLPDESMADWRDRMNSRVMFTCECGERTFAVTLNVVAVMCPFCTKELYKP